MIIVRQQVGAPQIEKLDPMLERPQEPIGQRKPLAVLAAHIAVVDQAPQCWQRGARPQSLVDPPVHELQQLHGELDVA